MYNLFSGAQRKTFVQFICGDARKKMLVHKKMHGKKLLWWRVRLGSPAGEVNFFLKKIYKPTQTPLYYTMTLEMRKKTGTLKVGGELMLQLLRTLRMETLVIIREDLGSENFGNTDLVRTVDTMIASRKRERIIEEGDTISMDFEVDD